MSPDEIERMVDDEYAQTSSKDATALWSRCQDIAKAPRILDLFYVELQQRGIVGEEPFAKMIYLAVTSRLLENISSVAAKGPSAAGKSFTLKQTLQFFPASAFYELSGMSEHALAYSKEPLKHRMLVIYEAAGMAGEFASYLVRSLLSEGRIRYETVEKTKAGIQARLIEREGPTGLLITTTAILLHPENETRLISITANDTREQTAAVMRALASEDQEESDLAPWHALQEWLALQPADVTIPFAAQLARLVPPVAVRLRRDFGQVLNLIRAHALLHQATRQRDERGRIVATLDDYEVVRELVAPLISEGVGATVSKTIRETVQAVKELIDEGSMETVSVAMLTTRLKLDPSAVSRRARAAAGKGYLKNQQLRHRQEAQYVLGAPFPDDVELLPSRADLERVCTCAGGSEGVSCTPAADAPGSSPDHEVLVL